MTNLYIGKMGFNSTMAITSVVASEFGNALIESGRYATELKKGPKNSFIAKVYFTLLRSAMLVEQAVTNMISIERLINSLEKDSSSLSDEDQFVLNALIRAFNAASTKLVETRASLDKRLFNDDDEETSSMGTLDSEEDDIASVVDTVGVAATEEDIADFSPELRSLLETLRSSGQEVKIRKITVKS